MLVIQTFSSSLTCSIICLSYKNIYITLDMHCKHGPYARNVKLRVAHAPGTFSPPPLISVTHVPGCMPGSVISGFLWNQWQGKRSRHSRRMRNPQFYVSGKRPMHWMSAICRDSPMNNKSCYGDAGALNRLAKLCSNDRWGPQPRYGNSTLHYDRVHSVVSKMREESHGITL